ncbi:S1 RNA-binding domain-containing protein [Lactobacillus xylocopicola]|uniref:30S ribosomal protein S1 n=1 Tax=Lactobacillus xylocopicola TaxID=2976676 RepID=A0ABN6SMI1_9LACO|nr:S1 RNA-binding domain-containing protein [Lactobacillus xylocopicola]BDR60933.1 30S ribosomal protein S1 [Lactobacillus xylocopicola]
MRYQVGQRLTGVVNNVSDLGVFLTLAHNKSGLIHYSDFGDNWPRERRRYQVGQTLRVVVSQINRGKIGLSRMRVNDPALIDPTNQFTQITAVNFLPTLSHTVESAQVEIKKLEQELTKYAN